MERRQFPYRLYLVTDEQACLGRDLIQVTEEAVRGGVDLVQLREKKLTREAFLEKALRMKDMLDRYRVPLIINDNLWVAVQCQAAGLHVGNTDVAPDEVRRMWQVNPMIGYSVEEEVQIKSVSARHANYLGISPVFATPTKTDTITEWGLDGVRQIRSISVKPLVAIGGINKANARHVIAAGADCLAVVSAICSADHPAHAAELIRNEIEKEIKA
ncbi:MAG: thiamine phosphate synthase [Cytophaga sp.]|nr:thiamine phosphate synthase [Cytophaga sp.]